MPIIFQFYRAKSPSSVAVPNSIRPSSSVYATVVTPSFTRTSVLPSWRSISTMSPCTTATRPCLRNTPSNKLYQLKLEARIWHSHFCIWYSISNHCHAPNYCYSKIYIVTINSKWSLRATFQVFLTWFTSANEAVSLFVNWLVCRSAALLKQLWMHINEIFGQR